MSILNQKHYVEYSEIFRNKPPQDTQRTCKIKEGVRLFLVLSLFPYHNLCNRSTESVRLTLRHAQDEEVYIL